MNYTKWKTFRFTSVHLSVEAILRALGEKHIVVDDIALAIFDSPYFKIKSLKNFDRTYDLITPRNVGVRGTVLYAEFVYRAEKSGLKTYSAHEASMLRLCNLEQRVQEELNTGMEPVRLKNGKEAIFTLNCPHKGIIRLCGKNTRYNLPVEDTQKFVLRSD